MYEHGTDGFAVAHFTSLDKPNESREVLALDIPNSQIAEGGKHLKNVEPLVQQVSKANKKAAAKKKAEKAATKKATAEAKNKSKVDDRQAKATAKKAAAKAMQRVKITAKNMQAAKAAAKKKPAAGAAAAKKKPTNAALAKAKKAAEAAEAALAKAIQAQKGMPHPSKRPPVDDAADDAAPAKKILAISRDLIPPTLVADESRKLYIPLPPSFDTVEPRDLRREICVKASASRDLRREICIERFAS